jgi:hypothetical protein
MVLNLFCVPGYAMANSLKYAQNPRKYLVAKATLLDVVSLTDSGWPLPDQTRSLRASGCQWCERAEYGMRSGAGRRTQSFRETTLVSVAFASSCFRGFWAFSDYLPVRRGTQKRFETMSY